MILPKVLIAPSALPVFLFGLLASCDGSSQGTDAGAFLVRDSFGISLAHNTGPDRTLEAVETLRIGVIDGDPNVQFHGIGCLTIDSSGGFWLCDSHESIRYYDESGEFQRQLGGHGEGPGEAPKYWGKIWIGAKTFLAYSVAHSFQSFDFEGRFLGSRDTRSEPLEQLIPMGPVGDNWTFRLRRLPPLESLPAPETWVIGRGPGTTNDFDSLYALDGQPLRGEGTVFWAKGSFFDGTPSIDADGLGRVFYSDPFQYRIEVYSPSGILERIVSREVDPIPYTEGLREEIEVGMRRAYEILAPQTPSREALVKRRTEQALPAVPPPHLPMLDLVLVSSDGHIWAQRADLHPRPALRAVASSWGMVRGYWLEEWKAPRHFDLFTPEGEYRGSVVLPAAFSPLDVTADRAYGFVTDSLDVQYVSVFSVRLDNLGLGGRIGEQGVQASS